MFKRKDKAFAELLVDPEKLACRLNELSKGRLMHTCTAIFGGITYFVIFFMEIHVMRMGGGAFPGAALILGMALFSFIQAVLAQTEIRSLLIYQTLHDLKTTQAD